MIPALKAPTIYILSPLPIIIKETEMEWDRVKIFHQWSHAGGEHEGSISPASFFQGIDKSF